MDYQFSPYLWLLFLSAVFSGAMAIHASQRREVPGATPFALMTGAACFWAVTNALELAAVQLQVKLFWANLQYFAYTAVPVLWLSLALKYTGRDRWLTPRRLALLFVVPALTVVFIWTNPAHGLMRHSIYLDTSGPISTVGKSYGPWFWVHTGYSYLLLTLAAAQLIQARRSALPLGRKQSAVLLLGLLLPLVSNVLYVFGVSPFEHDVAPAVFSLSGVIVAVGLFRYRLFDLRPFARDTVLESMDDGLVVLDARDRVVDLNQSAARLLGGTPAAIVGKRMLDVASTWPDLQECLQNACPGHCQATVWTADRQLCISVHVSPLADPRGLAVGRTLLLNDITEPRRQALALRQYAERLKILHEIDRAILAAKSAEETASVALQHIRSIVPCQRASVLLWNWENMTARVLAIDAESESDLQPGWSVPLEEPYLLPEHQQGEPLLIDDLQALEHDSKGLHLLADEGFRTHLSVPLAPEGEIIGTLNLSSRTPAAFDAECLEISRQVATSLAVALRNTRFYERVRDSRERLQSLSRRLVDVQEKERQAIARELHDEAGQALTSLLVGLGVLENKTRPNDEAVSQINELKQTTEGVLEGLHRLAVNLRPASLDRLGLVTALHQYINSISRQSGLDVQLETVGLDGTRLAPEMETTLYRIVQESLTNIVRHARATHASVILQLQEARIIAIVEDDGVGFDVEQALQQGRLGLFGMQERAEMHGGSLTIESRPGAGTTVHVVLPYVADPVVNDR